MFEEIPYRRPLVVGAGGGNDIVSATLILADLARAGRKPDLAGICSPGAWHLYEGKEKQPVEEQPVNVVSESAKRYRPSRIAQPLSFIDANVPGLLKKEGIDAKVYNLSCRYGSSRLIMGLQRLVRESDYDGIIAVDVGGDILSRGPPDPTILSPLMDFSTLYVLSQLETPSTLVEFGLQTDGELRPKNCEDILAELGTSGILKSTLKINPSDPAVEIYKRVYEGIANIRHGHTAAMTFETLNAKDDIHTNYRARVRILNKEWTHEFPIVLEAKYFGKAFIFDPKELAQRRVLAIPYSTPLELFIKTKNVVDTKTEMDLLYAWDNDVCIWLGLLCPQIEGSQREEILSYGIDNLDGYADVALLWKKDARVIPAEFKVKDNGKLVVAGRSKDDATKVANTLETP